MSCLRRVGFWVVDFLRGSGIRKQYNDIVSKGPNYNNDEDVKRILEYCKQNIPFYKEITGTGLTDFPVINKQIFKQEGQNCLSSEFVGQKGLYIAQTSGSTGTPLKVYVDRERKNRSRAELIIMNNSFGWKVGERYFHIRNWQQGISFPSKLKRIIQNLVPVPTGNFDKEKKDCLIKQLKRGNNNVIVGYSSSVCDFTNYCIKTNQANDLKIKLIICDSDELTDINKNRIEQIFNCDVVNRYSNEENGLLGYSFKGDNSFHINTASIRMELLKIDSNEYVDKGEIGRVVITDLYNRAMPLIRYDTGDLGITFDNPCDVHVLNKLVGRISDYLLAINGRKIYEPEICAVFETLSDIEKYQLIQTNRNEILVKYVGDSEKCETIIKQWLNTIVGDGVIVTFKQCEDISKQKSGKYKTIINELNY